MLEIYPFGLLRLAGGAFNPFYQDLAAEHVLNLEGVIEPRCVIIGEDD
jgi:hypothetical protein